MSPPTEAKAIVIDTIGKAAIKTLPLPQQRDDYILVRTTAVGLNPTDWKHVQGFGDAPGARLGCDWAGVVEHVGPQVTKSFRKGDRIAGVAHGGNARQHEDGAFGEYIMVKGDLAIKIPDNLTDEEAATLGVGISTVGQGLYQALNLPLPDSPASTSFPLLIYGGSTATGLLGIQFAKLSGAKVAVTCSPRNFELVKSYGADAAFDYNSPTVVADIKAWGNHAITSVWDCIVTPESTKICVGAISDAGGRYQGLLFPDAELVKSINPKVEIGVSLAYTVFGEEFKKGKVWAPVPEDFARGKAFWELSRTLLAEGKVKVVKPEVNRGGKGLEGVMVGLEELKQNKVSGGKLVYTI